jgi:NOL1/NOP2/fmu family ribosome biogenesis protein
MSTVFPKKSLKRVLFMRGYEADEVAGGAINMRDESERSERADIKNMRFLNRKEIKEIQAKIFDNWGAKVEDDEFAFLMNGKNRLFIVGRDIEKLELPMLRINNVGIYFGELTDRGEFRLTIEGSSIVGRRATKNVFEIDKERARSWFKGEDLEVESGENAFVIIRHGSDFLGCGKLVAGRIINYVPKARRVPEII